MPSSFALVAVVLTTDCVCLSTHDCNTITGAGVGAVASAILPRGTSEAAWVGGSWGYIGSWVRKWLGLLVAPSRS